MTSFVNGGLRGGLSGGSWLLRSVVPGVDGLLLVENVGHTGSGAGKIKVLSFMEVRVCSS